MLTERFMTHFKKDFRLMKKRGLNMPKLKAVMHDLIHEIPLESKLKEHPLKGNYAGYLECHVEPDWLLVYRIDTDEKEIYFSRTGTHADVFE